MSEQELVFALALSTLSGGLLLAIWMRIEAVAALRRDAANKEEEVSLAKQGSNA